MRMLEAKLKEQLMNFLSEDVGFGDITTDAVVPAASKVRAHIIVKEPTVVAGISEAKTFFEMIGASFTAKVEDGDEVTPETVIAEVEGEGRTVLMAERTILNILMRMSGIATTTRKLVEKISDAGLSVRIAATRKTAPGLRYFDKKAVLIGGGDPHRLRLDDAYLIKDNHLKIAGGVKEALEKVRSVASFYKKVEVEAKTVKQAIEAAKSGADIVMLDNMTLKEASATMKALAGLNLGGRVLIEISGGVTQEKLLEYAKLKPDVISLGLLTHSVRAIDVSLEVVETRIE